ncbi:MAG: hypothetical protein KHZ90_09780 [Veillonella parvula]|uniref:Uncharacterized protein n=1 Tax=Veillonella parvula TaxID=29466 RepID=A0A942WVN2_VEIPA|nr:hypothetical protein [Veillonella parvula]MBS4894045.1 hypothetical protein [Veillonella parvula]
MRDILGRKINEDDLVVAKGTGRHSNGLNIGIWKGKSVRFKHYSSSYSELFLIENPSETELKYKQEILDQIEKEKQAVIERETKRKAMKRIPKKDLVIGQEYINDKGNKYFYLGQGSYKTKGCWKSKPNGRGILLTYTYDNKVYKQENFDLFREISSRKTLPRFVKATERKVKLNKNIKVNRETGWGGTKSIATIEISLEEVE